MRTLLLLFITMQLNPAFASTPEYVEVQGVKPLADPYTNTADTKYETEPSALFLTMPNVNAASGANRPRFFQIRGIGESSQFEHSQVNAVGVFYEGIDLSEEASVLPLLGRESLILGYGPQSLNWGGKAFAGAIESSSCLGAVCPRGHWDADAGNFATYSARGGHIYAGENLSVLLGAGVTYSDGFIDNTYLGRPTMKVDEKEAVLGLAYRLGPVRLRQHHIFSQARNGYDAWSFEPSYKTLSERPGVDRHSVNGHSLAADLPLAGVHLKSLSSVTIAQNEESYDEDWGNDEYWNQVPGWNADYDYFARFERRRLKMHQKVFFETPSNFKAGLHWSSFRESQIIRSFVDGDQRRQSEPRFATSGAALFAEKEWQTDGWVFAAGARAESQTAELNGVGSDLSKSMAPQWALDLKAVKAWDARFSSQLRLRRGYRGGGYNTSDNVPADLLAYGPEQLYLAEFGTARTDSDLVLAAQVFHQWQEHAQTRTSIQPDPTDPDTYTYFTANTSGLSGYGAEVSAVKSWREWRFTGNMGLLKNRYHDYKLGTRDLGGREVEQSPSWTALARAEFNPKPWGFTIQASGRDGYYHSIDHDFQSKPYWLTDASVSYFFEKWELRGWVKNAFDKRYPVRAYYFANEPPDWAEKFYQQLGPPRTFGLQAVYEY